MQISEINMLTPFQITLKEEDSSESVLVFFEHTSKKVFFVGSMEQQKKEFIENELVKHCSDSIESLDFAIPAHIFENMSHARQGDKSFFGLTPDMENISVQNEKTKK
jgi:hypothetical protein